MPLKAKIRIKRRDAEDAEMRRGEAGKNHPQVCPDVSENFAFLRVLCVSALFCSGVNCMIAVKIVAADMRRLKLVLRIDRVHAASLPANNSVRSAAPFVSVCALCES